MKNIKGLLLVSALAFTGLSVSFSNLFNKEVKEVNATTDISSGKVFIGGQDIVLAENQTVTDATGGYVKLEGHTLTFNNYRYNDVGYKPGSESVRTCVYVDAEYDMDFIFEGENALSILSADTSISKYGMYIYSHDYDLAFKGDGSLTINLNNSQHSFGINSDNQGETAKINKITIDGPRLNMDINNANGNAVGFNCGGYLDGFQADLIINSGALNFDVNVTKNNEMCAGLFGFKSITMYDGILNVGARSITSAYGIDEPNIENDLIFEGGSVFLSAGTTSGNNAYAIEATVNFGGPSNIYLGKNINVFSVRGITQAMNLTSGSKLYNVGTGESWTDYEGTTGEEVINPNPEGGAFSSTAKKIVIYGAEEATYTTTPSAKADLVANGSAQALVNAGTSNQGTVVYRLGDSGDFSATIPTATNAGTYTVQHKILGDDDHKNSTIGLIDVTIIEAPAPGPTPPEPGPEPEPTPTPSDPSNGLPGWGIALIVVGSILLACCGAIVLLFVFWPRYVVDEANKAIIRTIFVWKNKEDKVILVSNKCKVIKANKAGVYKSKADAEKALNK